MTMGLAQIREQLREKKRKIDNALEMIEELDTTAEAVVAGVVATPTVAEVARVVLAEDGPMRTKALAVAIQQRGFVTKSKDFYPVVYKAMRTHGEFENTSDGWNLKQAS